MINIATRTPFDWQQDLGASGTIVIDANKKSTLTALTAPDTARIKKIIEAKAGQVVKFRCLARRTAGADGSSPKISLQYPTEGTEVTSMEITSSSWEKITLDYQIPHTTSETDYITFTVGVGSSEAGSVEVAELEILTEMSQQPTIIAHACATIQIASGVASASANYAYAGINALSYDAPSKKITVNINKSTASKRLFPTLTANILLDTNINLVAKCGLYNPATGNFNIQCIDTTTGLAVDLTPLPTTYISIHCFGL